MMDSNAHIEQIMQHLEALESLCEKMPEPSAHDNQPLLQAVARMGGVTQCLANRLSAAIPNPHTMEHEIVAQLAPDHTPNPHSEPAPSPQAVTVGRPPFNLKQLVSVMDYYHYLKELFGNDADLLAHLTEVINQSEGMTEASDYIYQRMHWDPNEPLVVSFFELLDHYYQTK